MRVALVARPASAASPGGDTTQIVETASALRLLNVAVDVVSARGEIDYQAYDLLHFFNIIRPADILRHCGRAACPYVVSPIFVDYAGVPEEHRGACAAAIKRLLTDDGFEYLKTIGRAWRSAEPVLSPSYLLLGHARAIRHIAGRALMLLPNSESEYARFVRHHRCATPHRVVPNGVRLDLVERAYPVSEEYRDAVVCMGRIESRKNQLNLIRALNGTRYRLFIHGRPSPNHQSYFERCLREAGANITVGGWLEGEALYRAYANARVHVLPSYCETTGLSSLEAAAAGCGIVVTDRGDTREYFRDDAWYCEPDSPDSIRAAVERAYEAGPSVRLRTRIRAEYTWTRAAAETKRAYEEVLREEHR